MKPLPGVEIGAVSTRVLCRGRLPKGVAIVEVGCSVIALGGGASGCCLRLSERFGRTSGLKRQKLLCV